MQGAAVARDSRNIFWRLVITEGTYRYLSSCSSDPMLWMINSVRFLLWAQITASIASIGEPVAETYFVRNLLLPELDAEIGKTRRLFEALPDGKSDFKPHEKSMTLGRLAGHTTDLFRLIAFTLTMSELDMAVAWQPYTMALKREMLERFEKNASDALAAFRQSSDETFRQPWTIKRGPNILFSADRFTYYRNQGINQIVHHRAQLGTYLRALGLPLPGMYGTSADGI
jgi:uncharacterized damage-inducible protein DinB